jgi:hypothetical protein
MGLRFQGSGLFFCKKPQTFDFSNPFASMNAYITSNTRPIGLFINSSNFVTTQVDRLKAEDC